jgi:hypothetical protein
LSIFTKETWKGTVKVEVDVGLPKTAEVFITDHTGEGLAEEELHELLRVFLNVIRQEDDPGELHVEKNEPEDRKGPVAGRVAKLEGCAGELVDVALLLVRVAVVRFDALVDVTGSG